MNPRNGNAAAGPSRRHGRKRRKHAREDVGGASGSGDGSETEANFPYRGVSFPSPKVEIKDYLGPLHFYRTMRGMSRREAAIVYDLALAYRDADYPEEKLNIRDVVRVKMEENTALAKPQDLRIGKEFYARFVGEHPLTIPREQWKKENFAAVQDEIVAKASECLRALEEEIARKCRVRGRQRTDLVEILPSLSEDDSYDLQQCSDLRKEIQDLKDENQGLKDKAAEDASTITRLQEMLQKASVQSQPEVLPQYDRFSEEDFLTENGPLGRIELNEEQLSSALEQSQPEVFPQDDLFSVEEWWVKYDFGEPAFN